MHLFRKQKVVSSNLAVGCIECTDPAAIAQLGERQTEDLKVPSSILGGGIVFV